MTFLAKHFTNLFKRKSIFTKMLALTLAFACVVGLSGCFNSNSNDSDDNGANSTPAQTEFTIQYTDDFGVHTLTVQAGMPYSIEVIPEREGYVFTGLFDAEVGGTKFVASNGASVSPFTDGKNMVLFPQYEPKNYTVILDYQGAKVVGSRQLSVSYGESLPELPKNLELEHKVFNGWYTQENCEGEKISDEYGLIPIVSVLNSKNFDISKDTIYLYAGFKPETFNVLCCFTDDVETETVVVEYDTPVSEIIPKTRVDKKAPIVWSKTYGGEPFNGKITGETVLYAVEYAPVIELDLNGGKGKTAYVARAGANISLPVPTKDYAKFSHWEDLSGNRFNSTTMPTNGAALKAVWQAKIVFDINGGSAVNDVSAAAGASIILPVPTRDGYVFAGWYTTDKDQYTETEMPAVGFKLKAGWYKTKSVKITVKPADEKAAYSTRSNRNRPVGPKADWRREVDLSKYIPSGGADVKVSIHVKMKVDMSGDSAIAGFYLYDNPVVSDAYLLQKAVDTVSSNSYKNFTFSGGFKMRSNILYMCYFVESTVAYTCAYYSDIWLDFEYPDVNYLYL